MASAQSPGARLSGKNDFAALSADFMIFRLTTVDENARSALECGGLTPPSPLAFTPVALYGGVKLPHSRCLRHSHFHGRVAPESFLEFANRLAILMIGVIREAKVTADFRQRGIAFQGGGQVLLSGEKIAALQRLKPLLHFPFDFGGRLLGKSE